MKAIVFGATGGTGLAAVRALIANGHQATAFVRSPDKLPADLGAEIISGDVLDAAAVAAAIPGHDAVIVALGATKRSKAAGEAGRVCATGTGHIITAMTASGVKRLLVVTTLGLGNTGPQTPLLFKLVMKTILKNQITDKRAQEALVMASGLDWTLVRPVGLSTKPGNGVWLLDRTKTRRMTIPRDDVGAALAALAASHDHVGEAVIVSG